MFPAALFARTLTVILPVFVMLSSALGLAFPPSATAETAAPRFEPEPAAGRYLVASEAMSDPRFRRTVILIVEHSDKGTLGVIINRPGAIPAATLGEGFRDDPLRFGGPVEPRRLSMIFQDSSSAEAADPGREDGSEDSRVLELPGDLRFVLGRDAVFHMHSLLDGAVPRRIFAGYASWGPGQLAAELSRNEWHLIENDPSLAFSDEDPRKIWSRLIRKLRGAWI
jgi:putative transcriptional regulator